MDPHAFVDWKEIFTDALKIILGMIWVSGRRICRDLNHAFKMIREHEARLEKLEGRDKVESCTSHSTHEGGH